MFRKGDCSSEQRKTSCCAAIDHLANDANDSGHLNDQIQLEYMVIYGVCILMNAHIYVNAYRLIQVKSN